MLLSLGQGRVPFSRKNPCLILLLFSSPAHRSSWERMLRCRGPLVVGAGEQGWPFSFGKRGPASNLVQSGLQSGEEEQRRGLGLARGVRVCRRRGGSPCWLGP